MLISIIIPCYNVANYISECVASCYAQTHHKIEVICIDNNSSDNTWQKLKYLQEQYPSLIVQKELKPGAPAARNNGLKIAKGEWIQFLDADDILLPNKIENQVKLIDNNVTAFIVGNYCIQENKNLLSIEINSSTHHWVLLATNSLGNTCANLFNTRFLKDANGWNEKLKSSQEYDLMFRLLKINDNIKFCSYFDTVINRIDNSISTNSASQYFNLLRRITLTKEILEYCQLIRISSNDIYQVELALFGAIREVFFMNRKKQSTALYYKYLGKHFIPQVNITNSKLFVICHKLLGYYFANLISLLPKKLRA